MNYPIYPEGFLNNNLKKCIDRKFCEGGCEAHSEELKVVRINDNSFLTGYDWGYFKYCDIAVKEDRRRGFKVIFEGEEDFE